MNRTHLFALALALIVSGCSGNHVSVSCSKDGDCDDGIFCNGTETCDTKKHKCVSASPPPCSDNVNCTADICDEITKGCLHLADNSQCTAGQACDVKGDCIPVCDAAQCTATCTGSGFGAGSCAGTTFCQCENALVNALAGHAFLFGHTAGDAAHDHSGIAIGLAGTTITAMTAADGSYSLMNVPAGVYTVTANKDKYVPGTAQAVVVASPMPTPPDITLNHGKLSGTMTSGPDEISANVDDVIYSADSSHVLVGIDTMSIGVRGGAEQLFAFPTSLASPPVDLFNLTSVKAVIAISAIFPFGISNDHLVYRAPIGDSFGPAVWSRPLDGSAPAIVLATAPAPSPSAPSGTNEGDVEIIGQVGKFTIIQTEDDKPTPHQFSWAAVHTDGSGSPINVWTGTPTASAPPVYFYNDDNVVVFGTVDSTGPTATMHSFNLNTSVDTLAPLINTSGPNVAFQTVSFDGITKDHVWVMGEGAEGGIGTHAFLLQVGTSNVKYASTASLAAGTGLAPGAGNAHPLDDSSGFAFLDITGGAGGYWFFGTTVSPAGGNPVQIVPQANIGGVAPTLVGRIVYYTDALNTPTANKVTISSIPGTGGSVVTQELGPSPSPVLGSELAADGQSANLVWIEYTGQLHGATIPIPLLSASVTAVNLGTPLSTDCQSTVRFDSAFANGFYYVCHDAQTLTGFAAPLTNTPIAVDTAVAGGPVYPLVSSRRVAYLKLDGTLWSASGSSKALLSHFAPGITTFPVNIDPWVFIYDHDAQFARVSNVSGAVIDEPLTPCDLLYANQFLDGYTPAQPTKLTDSVLTAVASCGLNNFNAYSVPLTNLP